LDRNRKQLTNVTLQLSHTEGGIIGLFETFCQRTKHPINNSPKVRRRMTVGVFQGSGPSGPIVRDTVKSKTPITSRANPAQSNRKTVVMLFVAPSVKAFGALWSSIVHVSDFCGTISGSGTLGTHAQVRTETIPKSPPKAIKDAFQLMLRARLPDPKPPIMVAAGVPMKKDEKTIFLRREFSGYTRLRMPRAIGIFAAQAIPVRPERTSRTTPV
jgi:hypothetical protein